MGIFSDLIELVLIFVVFLPLFSFCCFESLEATASVPVGFQFFTLLSGLSLFVEFFAVNTLSFGLELMLENTLLF